MVRTEKYTKDQKNIWRTKRNEELHLYRSWSHIVFTSCASPTSKKEENVPLGFIEEFLKNGASLVEIKRIFGEPDQKVEVSDIPEIIYKYDNKKHQENEWNFGIGKNRKLIWVNYRPWKNPTLDRTEVLPVTLKKYNCKEKKEPDTRVPHVIQNHRFFECAEGRVRAYYNMHGEIETIAVNR